MAVLESRLTRIRALSKMCKEAYEKTLMSPTRENRDLATRLSLRITKLSHGKTK